MAMPNPEQGLVGKMHVRLLHSHAECIWRIYLCLDRVRKGLAIMPGLVTGGVVPGAWLDQPSFLTFHISGSPLKIPLSVLR